MNQAPLGGKAFPIQAHEVRMTIPIYGEDIPYLTTEQMIEVDRAMIEDYKIELIQMMENAGRTLAQLARIRFLGSDPQGKRVTILAGAGGNGGGAMVCARRLHTYGAHVEVFTTKPVEKFTPVPRHQLDILQQMKIAVSHAATIEQTKTPDLIIDGIIGYSLKGNPRTTAADLIQWANDQAAPILALDTPSGVDTTTGTVYKPAIRATATMTLALPKEGLRAQGVEPCVGELYLADISVPPDLYAIPSLGLQVGPIFAKSDIIRLK